jgi:hypothetical protein
LAEPHFGRLDTAANKKHSGTRQVCRSGTSRATSMFHCRETLEKHISGWYRTEAFGGLARAHHTSRFKVLRRDFHPQSFLRTREAALLHEGICQSVVTASIVCHYRHRPEDIAGITNLQERLYTRSIAISGANICVLAQRNSKINAVTCYLSRRFEQYRYLDSLRSDLRQTIFPPPNG